MKHLKTISALLLLLLWLPGCGYQLVEFGDEPDASATADTSDATTADTSDATTADTSDATTADTSDATTADTSDATTADTSDTSDVNVTPPIIEITSPLDAATDVALNVQPSATFDKAMDAATLNPLTFTLSQGLTPIPGVISLNGTTNTATFSPTVALTPNSQFTALLTTGATDAEGNALVADYAWSFTTGAVSDALPPTVTLTAPINGVTVALLDQDLTATFSEAMSPGTISASSFTLRPFDSATSLLGVVTFDAITDTATFNPDLDLTPNTAYTATITIDVTDLAGNAMTTPYTWSFTTAATPDTTTPSVIFTLPLDLSTDVALNTSTSATFSEVMDPSTLDSPALNFTLTQLVGNIPVPGVVTYSGLTATFAPDSPLLPNTTYTSTVTTGAQDPSGNALSADTSWTWTTASAPDLIPPTILITFPADLALDVPTSQTINATFSEEMLPSTLTSLTMRVEETLTGDPVPGNVAYDVQNMIATFTPLLDLSPGLEYTVTVTNQTTDLANNALLVPPLNGLPVPNPWTFTTALDPVPPPPLAINLRGIASFGIASRAGLTSTGVVVVNGDVALYPLDVCVDATGNAGASQTCLLQTYSSPTGLTVNGSIYFANDLFDAGGTANSVSNDLNIAWVEGMAKVDTRGPVSGDELDLKTLTAGVYHNASLSLAANGVLTLDAQNDANAIFIFKVDSSFVDSGTVLLPSRIDLLNGAQAQNVWFITGLDITIGSGTTWNGNILAGRTATINDGSTVLGRVLAGASGAGAVTFSGAASPSLTSITVP
jgi:hypothetical protein